MLSLSLSLTLFEGWSYSGQDEKTWTEVRRRSRATVAIINQTGRAIKYIRSAGDDSFRQRGGALHYRVEVHR